METKEQVLKAIRTTARKKGVRSLSKRAFLAATGATAHQVARHFESWNKAIAAAGLAPNFKNEPATDAQLFAAMRDAFLKAGRICSRTRFAPHFPYSISIFRARGLNWPDALAGMVEWIERNDPGFPYLDQLPGWARPGRADLRVWPARTGPKFGAPLNFRGMLHAPTTEMGVVMLFAILAPDLGFVIESAQQAFPDCHAKRHVGHGRWQRVRVEFELVSRNFRDHRHDPRQCDVIVCWEHTWRRCPLEVIELKAEIEKLRKEGKG